MVPEEDWKLPRRSEQCSACATELLPGTRVTTVISLRPEGPARRDLCTSCGEAAESGGDDCFWKRLLPESGTRRQVVDDALVAELFERMLPRLEEAYRRLVYLLALLLVRRRRLKLVGFERRAGRDVMLASRGAGQAVIEVPAPALAPEDLPPLRDQLSRLLAADLVEGDLAAPGELASG